MAANDVNCKFTWLNGMDDDGRCDRGWVSPRFLFSQQPRANSLLCCYYLFDFIYNVWTHHLDIFFYWWTTNAAATHDTNRSVSINTVPMLNLLLSSNERNDVSVSSNTWHTLLIEFRRKINTISITIIISFLLSSIECFFFNSCSQIHLRQLSTHLFIRK